MADKMIFPTTGGGRMTLTEAQIEALEKEFPLKDVQGTLDELQKKMYAGKYQYTAKGFTRAIRSWLTRAPEDPGRKLAQTVPPEESYWYHREQAQYAGYEPDTEAAYLPDDKVSEMLEALKASLRASEPDSQYLYQLPPREHWRACAHSWEPSWMGGDWCSKCGLLWSQIEDMFGLMRRLEGYRNGSLSPEE